MVRWDGVFIGLGCITVSSGLFDNTFAAVYMWSTLSEEESDTLCQAETSSSAAAMLLSVFNSTETDENPPLLQQHVRCLGSCEEALRRRGLFPCRFDSSAATAHPLPASGALLGLGWGGALILLVSCCPCCFLVGVVTLVSAFRESSFSLLPHKWSCENPLAGHLDDPEDDDSVLKEV